MKKLFLSILVVAGLGVAVWAGIASGAWTKPVSACATLGKSEFCGGGAFNPAKLPKKTRVPIALKTNGSVKNDDGTVPPVVDIIQVDFDDDGTVSTKGIPQCDIKNIRLDSPKLARKKCSKALVGTGTVEAVVEFKDDETGEPIDDPIAAFGPLSIFNGKPRGGKPTVIFHTLLEEPLPLTYVTDAVIENSKKKGYGKRIHVKVPPIVNGQGTFVGFKANVKKKVSKKKYLLLRCSSKSLKVEAEIKLKTESKPIKIGLVSKCQQAKEPKKKKKGKAKTKKGKRR